MEPLWWGLLYLEIHVTSYPPGLFKGSLVGTNAFLSSVMGEKPRATGGLEGGKPWATGPRHILLSLQQRSWSSTAGRWNLHDPTYSPHGAGEDSVNGMARWDDHQGAWLELVYIYIFT